MSDGHDRPEKTKAEEENLDDTRPGSNKSPQGPKIIAWGAMIMIVIVFGIMMYKHSSNTAAGESRTNAITVAPVIAVDEVVAEFSVPAHGESDWYNRPDNVSAFWWKADEMKADISFKDGTSTEAPTWKSFQKLIVRVKFKNPHDEEARVSIYARH